MSVVGPAAKLFACELPHIQYTAAAPKPFTHRGRAFGRVWVQV